MPESRSVVWLCACCGRRFPHFADMRTECVDYAQRVYEDSIKADPNTGFIIEAQAVEYMPIGPAGARL